MFGEQGVIDMLGINGYYTFLAMIMNGTRTAVPDGKLAPLQPFPK
jgi:4-carboxymuconolactone decarboxylase